MTKVHVPFIIGFCLLYSSDLLSQSDGDTLVIEGSTFIKSEKTRIYLREGFLFSDEFTTPWHLNHSALTILDSLGFKSRIYNVSGIDLFSKTFRKPSKIVVQAYDTSKVELAIVTNTRTIIEEKGILKADYEIQYNFFIQIKKHIDNGWTELEIGSNVIERRKGVGDWVSYFNERNYESRILPKTIRKEQTLIESLLVEALSPKQSKRK